MSSENQEGVERYVWRIILAIAAITVLVLFLGWLSGASIQSPPPA